MRLFVDHAHLIITHCCGVRTLPFSPQRDWCSTQTEEKKRQVALLCDYLGALARCAWNIDEVPLVGRRRPRWWPAVQLLNRNPISRAIDLITALLCVWLSCCFFSGVCMLGRTDGPKSGGVIEFTDNLKWAEHVKQKPSQTQRCAIICQPSEAN